jgi:acetyl esterase/lipase
MTRRSLAAFTVLLFLVPLARCTPASVLNVTIGTDGLVVQRGLAYGPKRRQALDVYRPRRPGGLLPVVVFFYGGSWRKGARDDYRFVADALARKGVVVVVPDYRIYPAVEFPGFLEDCATAVAFVRAHAAQWHGDTSRLFLAGHSAGAYNAAMLALDPRWLAAVGMRRRDLAGWVGIAGPYDFLPITEEEFKPVFASAAGDLAATQPINFADAGAPRTLLLHGAADKVVPPQDTTALAARLRAAGADLTVRMYPGVGHMAAVLGFSPLFRWESPVLADVVRFVRGP